VIINLNHVAIYQSKTLILSDVHFSMQPGEFVYLIGKTGTGKSSLLKTLYGDLTLTHGAGEVAGYDLKKLTWKTVPFLRRKLGIVFQDFQLLTDRNVHDNLIFALEATGWDNKKKIEDRIEETLNLVGLKTKSFKMPHELSGGEQQRVVVARALLNSPQLILADEPTGNLDPETSDEIIQLLMKIAKESNTAMLIATHDYMIMQKFAARTIKCENGKVTDATGSVQNYHENAYPEVNIVNETSRLITVTETTSTEPIPTNYNLENNSNIEL
jgi:cell division transport system ATP-binding protein